MGDEQQRSFVLTQGALQFLFRLDIEMIRGLIEHEQVDRLLESLGLDAFDHYISKLANFIIKNKANVASHYDTIMKWWREDSGS